jgi:hypothetical protein
MLTLDETTLFYYFRRTQPGNSNKKAAGVINNWRDAVEIQPRAAARVNASNSGGTASGRSTGSVRSESTTLFKSTTTNATLDKTVVAALEDEEAEELEQHNSDACGGLGDEFELNGPEGEFARLSPFKGKKRVTNDVSPLLYLHCPH